MEFSVLHEDEDLWIINKPAGILVHRSEATSRREPAILQLARDHLGQHLYPVHRLDRPTSGVLVLARSREMASQLSRDWNACSKTYWAIVRGWPVEELIITRALKDLDDPAAPEQDARTQLKRLLTVEVEAAVDRYPQARYSLCELGLETGRRHQLRRHMKAIFHPVIGDTIYGHGPHNRFFRERYAVSRLLLHHRRMSLSHPRTGAPLTITAPLDADWDKLFTAFDWALPG